MRDRQAPLRSTMDPEESANLVNQKTTCTVPTQRTWRSWKPASTNMWFWRSSPTLATQRLEELHAVSIDANKPEHCLLSSPHPPTNPHPRIGARRQGLVAPGGLFARRAAATSTLWAPSHPAGDSTALRPVVGVSPAFLRSAAQRRRNDAGKIRRQSHGEDDRPRRSPYTLHKLLPSAGQSEPVVRHVMGGFSTPLLEDFFPRPAPSLTLVDFSWRAKIRKRLYCAPPTGASPSPHGARRAPLVSGHMAIPTIDRMDGCA